ncbi:MAG: histidine kinase [Bacteroidota bacterium]|nr:histidine kinase [Bacteroidota bacterium]
MRFQSFAAALLAWTLLLGALLCASGAHAQAALLPPPDSLKTALRNSLGGVARARVLLRIAYAYFDFSDTAGTTGYARAARRLAHELRNAPLEGQAADALGFYYQWRRDQRQAAPQLLQAELLLRGGAAPARAANYFHLARLNTDLSHALQARRYYRRSIALFRQLHDPAHEAEVLNAFSDNYLLQGQKDSAIYCLVQASRLAHQLGMKAEEALLEANIAVVLLHQNELVEASRHAHLALQGHYKHDNLEYRVNTFIVLGHIARAQDSLEVALRYYRLGARLARQFNQTMTVHYENIASIEDRLGRRDSAVFYQRMSVRLSQQLHQVAEQSQAMASLARYYLHLGRLSPATRWAQAAQAVQGNTHVLANTLPLLVLKEIAVAKNDYREALRLTEQIQAADSTQQAHESQRLAEDLRVGYETEQAEQRVKVLEQDQQLAALRRQRELAGGMGAGLLGLVLAVGGLVRYRRRQRRKEHLLRQRLAADLHDDVGGLLTQISIDSALLHTGIATHDQQQRLVRIAESSRQAVRQMGDIIWSIDSPEGTWANVIDRMRDQAYEVLAPVGIEIDFVVAPAVPALSLGLLPCQQLYLIYKEALHNVVKHSGAGLVRVVLEQRENQLVLLVHDNGRGKTSPAPGQGRGLGNMRRRAESVGGTVEYGCGQAAGFRVLVRLALS